MAEYILNGRIVAVNEKQSVASTKEPGTTIERRQVYLDCSRYDSLTGEKISENFPLLEFGGKGLEQLDALVKQGLKKGDIVSIKFAVQGNTYKDKDGKTRNWTGIRPYAIERYVSQRQLVQQAAPAPQPAQAPAPAPAPEPDRRGEDALPF